MLYGQDDFSIEHMHSHHEVSLLSILVFNVVTLRSTYTCPMTLLYLHVSKDYCVYGLSPSFHSTEFVDDVFVVVERFCYLYT